MCYRKIVCQVGYLPKLYKDARSEKYKIEGECSLVPIEETQILDKFKILCCFPDPWIRCLGLAPTEEKCVVRTVSLFFRK
jgi:hypothetical protein